MGNPSRKNRRSKRARRKKKQHRTGHGQPPPPERVMPPVMTPEQIETAFAPLRKAFANARKPTPETSDMETNERVSGTPTEK